MSLGLIYCSLGVSDQTACRFSGIAEITLHSDCYRLFSGGLVQISTSFGLLSLVFGELVRISTSFGLLSFVFRRIVRLHFIRTTIVCFPADLSDSVLHSDYYTFVFQLTCPIQYFIRTALPCFPTDLSDSTLHSDYSHMFSSRIVRFNTSFGLLTLVFPLPSPNRPLFRTNLANSITFLSEPPPSPKPSIQPKTKKALSEDTICL